MSHYRFALTVINPTLVLGPLLTNEQGTSITLIRRFLNMEMPAVPALNLACVDVRDVAKAHLEAMRRPATDGERILDDSRRNIILTNFGYGAEGTFDLILSNFTVPDRILSRVDSSENVDRSGVIGFSLSRGISIAAGVGSNPHVCQLQISIRFTEALRGKYYFIYHNCFNYRAHGYRSDLLFTTNLNLWIYGFKYFSEFILKKLVFILLSRVIFSDRVAVDFTVDIIEKNVGSYLSAGDIPKPQLLLYISLMFVFAGALWCHRLCRTELFSSKSNIYRVHGLMTALVFLKASSLFFHGVNYYFVKAVVELSTLFFFVLVGIKFRPQPSNPYLKLSQEEFDSDDIALTKNGLLEGIVNRNLGSTNLQMDDIPGSIGGLQTSDESDEDDAAILGTRRVNGLEKTLL
uniref:3Beta_HSD domain-containing protein n=1 Tax=Heterorhabditis bacteriophora TaxID=37862 RepID=A0A1I7XVB1_HETBA